MSISTRIVGGIVLLLALAGCARTEPAKVKGPPTPPPVAAATKPTVGGAERASLPDYTTQAKAQTASEQRAELQTKVKDLKVELPPKKP